MIRVRSGAASVGAVLGAGAVGFEQQAPRQGRRFVGWIALGSGGRMAGLLALGAGCRETVKVRATETVGERA